MNCHMFLLINICQTGVNTDKYMYIIYFHKVDNSGRTNSYIQIIIGNFQQNNFGNFQP